MTWTLPSSISSSSWSVGAETIARESLRIPDRSYDELRLIAERFLAEHHPKGTIPVPVEETIEFQLGLNIIPMPGPRRFFDIDGYWRRLADQKWLCFSDRSGPRVVFFGVGGL